MTKIKKYSDFITEKKSFSLSDLQKEVDKYETRQEFRKENVAAYKSAWSRNFLNDLFKNHPNSGYTIYANNYWTKEKLQEEANKYETRQEFKESDSKAYAAALLQKIMDELFKNHLNDGFTDKQKKSGYWTIDKLQVYEDKYKTMKEFRDNDNALYFVAKNKKLLSELFKNHSNKGYIYK